MAARSYATFDPSFKKEQQPSPELKASCASRASRATMAWVRPLMTLAHRKQLNGEDLWPLRASLSAETVSATFAHEFERDRSIPRAFMRMFGTRFVATGAAFFVSMLCNLVGPVTLNRVLSALTAKEIGGEAFSLSDGAWWIAFLFASQVIQALVDNYANYESEVIAIQFVAALKTLLYRKTMRLSARARMEKSTGDITNMYTSDSDSVLQAAFFIHQAWLVPLQISIVSCMLFRILGVASLPGIAVIVGMLAISKFIARRMFVLQRKFRNKKDLRMKKVAELFKAIGVVKLNTWENQFAASIKKARTAELAVLLKARITGSFGMFLMWGMPVFISIAAFSTYTGVLREALTPAIVFASLALFQLIQMPLRMVMQVVNSLVQAVVALERVSSFLDLGEVDGGDVVASSNHFAKQNASEDVAIGAEGGEFAWDDSGAVLKDVSLRVNRGELIVVHGPVGCGKSSLISALLGEMAKRRGLVHIHGSVAYCSQQPWIQNLTVRENILFGQPFDATKYAKVLDACALSDDLSALPAGDNTEIGERGVNLSGGQNARIALARACYADADVYLLDSPLAAVDAIVQSEIFSKCLLALLRGKTVILVTHNRDIIQSPFVSRALTITPVGNDTSSRVPGVLVWSRQTHQPSNYIPAVSPLCSSITATSSGENSNDTSVEESPFSGGVSPSPVRNEIAAQQIPASSFKKLRIGDFSGSSYRPRNFHRGDQNGNKSDEQARLIADEHRVHGRVGKQVYSAYYLAVGGMPIVLLVLLAQLLWQALQIGSDFWLSRWSNNRTTNQASAAPTTAYRLGVYSGVGLLAVATMSARTAMITVFGIRASRRLFDRMTTALLHAPMRFFDATPIGRLLTRYGGDTFSVDVMIPGTFGMLIGNIFSVGCSAITAALIIRWKGLLLLPILFIYVAVAEFYIAPAREIERLSKTTEAPVLNHLSESVEGGVILRAFGPQQVVRFYLTNSRKLDENSKARYAKLCVSQWFSIRIQLLGALLLLLVTSSLLLLHDVLDAAIIGLAFSYALKVSASLEDIVRVLTRVETLMVSPERMQEFIDCEHEAPARLPSSDPPTSAGWPFTGIVTFAAVDFRYKAHAPLVLRSVSFSIRGGDKVGVVGRTGAGKSSLTMALFRINELAGGSITIDGVDINTLGLTTLREKLSIIPQVPVLFKGPLRSYLDPFEEFTDDGLWRSLEQVGLRERVSSDELKLLLLVEENGENFSVGERQMICMARALLRSSRIVVFDEATAAIDHETDQKLQRVIRSAFRESTVLTIAHRLYTILDSDRVLVLHEGRVAQYASPAELQALGGGPFFELMREAASNEIR